MTTLRTVDYDPRRHIDCDYPTWTVTTADLCGTADHVVCADAKLIIVDVYAFDHCEEWALAHIAAHLDMHIGQIGSLNGELCAQADYLAQVRLDRECDRV